ncbi:MAG TPA: DUF4143 domain-containing protein [Bacteroidetes bacterium]|nr:DUF4143 domain-containing protein [Bacteroidota bacterium]
MIRYSWNTNPILSDFVGITLQIYLKHVINRFSNFNYREGRGALLENYVFTRLTEIYDSESIRFWRTTDKKEVDFIISSDLKTGLAFEVKIGSNVKKSSGFYTFKELYSGFVTNLLTYEFFDNTTQVLKI